MKLAIVGSRTFDCYVELETWVDAIFYMFDSSSICVISGGANGADSLAKKYIERVRKYSRYPDFLTEYIEFPADWNKYGKSAGFIRNQQIIDACDMVLAFWDGKSRGTADTIEKAKRAKKPTFIVYF